MDNQTTVTEFLLFGFTDNNDMYILILMMFLFIYLFAIMGNLIIIAIVILNPYLHTPMYYFLVNLSLSDICFISTTIPKSIAALWTWNRLISFAGCVAQVFLVLTFGGNEAALLTIMAYDRYIAICHPLQYSIIMNWKSCIQTATASWLSNLIHGGIHTIMTFKLHFCDSNVIGQYFCDIPQLQKISCSDTKVNQILLFAFAIIFDSFMVGSIFVSYGYIISAVIKIPSVQGRYKAFSTCIPHLTVFSLFMITGVFSYMRPKALSTPTVDLLSAVLYNVLPPLLNPIIYTLRNKDIQKAMWKIRSQLNKLLARFHYLCLI